MKPRKTTPPTPGVQISASRESQAAAAVQVRMQQLADRVTKAEAKRQGKPVLTDATVVEYIDWVATQLVADNISGGEATILLSAAELVISRTHAAAQGKPAQGLTPEESTHPA